MSNISLEAAVRTCKVNTGWANRIQSDRFENSDLMMCPVWNQRDLQGRRVCDDSFYTKREGCNSPLDRIYVENDQRPQYMEYITLDAQGFRGDMYGNHSGIEGFKPHVENYIMGQERTLQESDASLGCQTLDNVHNYTGQFGINTGFRQNIEPTCQQYPYEYAMAMNAQQNRYMQGMSQASRSEGFRRRY